MACILMRFRTTLQRTSTYPITRLPYLSSHYPRPSLHLRSCTYRAPHANTTILVYVHRPLRLIGARLPPTIYSVVPAVFVFGILAALVLVVINARPEGSGTWWNSPVARRRAAQAAGRCLLVRGTWLGSGRPAQQYRHLVSRCAMSFLCAA